MGQMRKVGIGTWRRLIFKGLLEGERQAIE